MKENYLINIEGSMEQSGEADSVQLLTRGSFVRRGNNFFITYKETEATGYEGNITTVKVEGHSKVSLSRRGPTPSQLIIEPGRRHVCHYDSGYGVLNLGVAADEVHNHLTDTGGNLSFSYTLDSGAAQISKNSVKITIQEAN